MAAVPGMSWQLIRAEGRPTAEVAFDRSVVAFFLEVADVLAVPKSVAAIYGICFASAAPLSYSEVKDRLNISSGSISQGLRVLREVGALKVVLNPADRREFFAPDLEMRKLISHYMEKRLERQLDSGRGRLEVIIKTLPKEKNDATKVLRGRLKTLQGWHDKTRTLLPVVKVFLKLT